MPDVFQHDVPYVLPKDAEQPEVCQTLDRLVAGVITALGTEFTIKPKYRPADRLYKADFVEGAEVERATFSRLAEFGEEHQMKIRAASAWFVLRDKSGQDVADLWVRYSESFGRSFKFNVEANSPVIAAGLRDRIQKLVNRFDATGDPGPAMTSEGPSGGVTNVYHGPVTQGSGNVISSVSGSTISQATASSGAPTPSASRGRLSALLQHPTGSQIVGGLVVAGIIALITWWATQR